MSIRIILADNQKILRQGLRSFLEKEPNMRVVAEADDGQTAVRLAQEMSPDVVILDTALANLNGIDATRQIIAGRWGNIKVLVLSMDTDRRLVRGMLRAGAAGYLPKDCTTEELVNAIRIVASNQTYLSPRIADIVVTEYVNNAEQPDSAFSVLTRRERQVLQLLAEGLSVKEISQRLILSVKTIQTHRKHTMDKLDVHSVADLTKYAVREGLTSL